MDEKYFDLLNKPEDYEKICKEDDEEDKNDVTFDDFDTSKKPINGNGSVNEMNGDSSEPEDENFNFDKKEMNV